MPQDAPWSLLSDAFWLLTTGAEARRTPPQSVRLGVAAAALCDLVDLGEVVWTGTAESSSVSVREACRCPEPTTRRWHAAMTESAAGGAMAARFALNPLVHDAWHDVACRLVAGGAVTEVPSRLRLARLNRYRVRDLQGVRARRAHLERAVSGGEPDPFQLTLVGAAWAAGAFDDLFRTHGITVGSGLTEAARLLLEDDVATGRLSAALAFSHTMTTGGLT